MRNYVNKNNKNIFNLKCNNPNNYQNNWDKLNINNINNNIIINKNLNIFYNNSPQQVFKKKTIGNSFSINDKAQKIKSINNSIDKNTIFQKINISKNNLFFNFKNGYKNEWKRKLIGNDNKYENSNIVEKIKVNRQIKNKNIFDINNFNTENTYSKFDNEIEDKITNNQKNQIIQRISRVLKNQKEREEKRKSLEAIKVKQKEIEKVNTNKKINNETNKDTKSKNENNNIYDKTPKEKNQNINDKTPKGENQNINDKTPKGNDISKDIKKTNTLSIKELINIPSSKKKNILELIKTNNLTNQLFSPDSKRLIQIGTDPKRIPKKESNLNSKTSVREMFKKKKNKF